MQNFNFIKFIVIFLLVSGVYSAYGQKDTITDFKKSYLQARQLAFDGKRDEARELAYRILKYNPNYYDAKLLIGRTLAWDKQYDSAIVVVNALLKKKSEVRDAYDLLIDIYKWSKQNETSLRYCNLGLSYYPNDKVFLYKKADLLYQADNIKLAKHTVEQLLAINPSHEKGNELLKKLKPKFINKVKISHSFDYFEKPWTRRWHLTSIEVSTKPKIGTIIGKVNLGQILRDGNHFFEDVRPQFEIDAYPKLTKKMYAYVSYGYAPNGYFPEHRSGLEIFRKFPYSFEASLGMRHLKWSDHVVFYTGSVGMYYKNLWFSFRPFIFPKSYGVSHSYNFFVRHYFKTAENYVGILVGWGSSPDDPANNSIIDDESLSKIKSKKIKLNYKKRIKSWSIDLEAGYKYEEYQIDSYRNNFDTKIGLTYNF